MMEKRREESMKPIFRICQIFVLVFAAAAPIFAQEPVSIDSNKQLFLDDYLIASKDKVTRTIHPAERYPGNPILTPDPAREIYALLFGSVIHDDGAYRMWYYSGNGVGYAESEDGIRWTKPQLDLFPVDGKPTNQIIKCRAESDIPNFIDNFRELFGVFKDADRYVMGFLSLQREYEGPRMDPFHPAQRRGLGVAVSDDGITWTVENSWATEAICDGGTHWMLDPRTGKYVLFGRTKFQDEALMSKWRDKASPELAQWVNSKYWGRSVARVESSDFLNWDYKDPATAPIAMTADEKDPPATEIYAMNVFPYGAAYIGLVQVFHNQPDACYLDIELAISRDGKHFERVEDDGQGRMPWLACGSVGDWDRFNTCMSNNPPIEAGDDLRFYYAGRSYRHSPYDGPDKGDIFGAIGMASIKKDRFVSLSGSYDPGVILTKPVKLSSSELHFNAKSDHGSVIVEILSVDAGTVLAKSKPLNVDSLDASLEWEIGKPPVGEPVRLRITLRNALLYAFWCAN